MKQSKNQKMGKCLLIVSVNLILIPFTNLTSKLIEQVHSNNVENIEEAL